MFENCRKTKRSLVRQEEGATLVEYALLLALIALVCVNAIAGIGRHAALIFQNIAGQF
jgi:pilus assembly protein Flp/PilA